MRGLALLRTGFSDDRLEHSLLDGIGCKPLKLGLSVASLLSEAYLFLPQTKN